MYMKCNKVIQVINYNNTELDSSHDTQTSRTGIVENIVFIS